MKILVVDDERVIADSVADAVSAYSGEQVNTTSAFTAVQCAAHRRNDARGQWHSGCARDHKVAPKL